VCGKGLNCECLADAVDVNIQERALIPYLLQLRTAKKWSEMVRQQKTSCCYV
jgi:hypothetical protein